MRDPAPPYANERCRAAEAMPLGDLVALHDDAEIELRVLPNLWPLWNVGVTSTVEYSGMRLRNAQPAK